MKERKGHTLAVHMEEDMKVWPTIKENLQVL